MALSHFRINYSFQPISFNGEPRVAFLDVDDRTLTVDMNAPVADIVEAVWDCAHVMARELHRLVPVIEERPALDLLAADEAVEGPYLFPISA